METKDNLKQVLHQCDYCEFSKLVYVHGKARLAGNGYSLIEHWNAVAEHHRDAEPVIITLMEHSLW